MTVSVDGKRFLEDLFAQGKIGWVKGRGLQRTAYSAPYFEARAWLKGKMEEVGLETRIDGVGNLFGRLKGKNKETILIGSHLDSVDNGGIYDGPLGIIAALEVLRAVKDAGDILKHSLEVVAFVGEEGEPLGGTFGSRAFAGLLPSDYRQDILAKFGVDENAVAASKGDLGNYAAFLELHIEQGPFLERKGFDIGVPAGIGGITRLEVRVRGMANHAGTTPMSERKDAMRASADLIHDWFAWMDGQKNLVCNIGVMKIVPGHVSVVPEEACFVLELRSIDDAAVKRACAEVSAMAKRVSPCTASIKKLGAKPVVLLDKRLVKKIKDSADKAGLSAVVMPSGASHDSSPIAHVIPTGMIFVPSHDGVSHSKDEFTTDDDVLHGVELLKEAVLAIDRDL